MIENIPNITETSNMVMMQIKTVVEDFLRWIGLDSSVVAFVRHVVLVVVTIFLAWGIYLIGRRVLVPLILRLERKTKAKWVHHLFNRDVLISASRILPAIWVASVLPLVFFEYPVVEEILKRLTNVYITVMVVKTLILFIDSFKRFDSKNRSATQQYFHTFGSVLKIILIVIAAVIIIAILIDRNPKTLLIGLGSASAIMMLVFKDTIEGLVAGIRLTSNDMLHKGDWITVPKANADGNVEEMTLTTVKIRNFDNSIVTVSPKTLVDDSFQNWIGMQESTGRRVSRQIYIDFSSIRPLTTDDISALKSLSPGIQATAGDINLTVFRQYTEDWLRTLPEVNTNMTLMVRQLKNTNSGLPIDVYFFLKEKEWVTFEHQSAAIMEHIYAAVPLFGLRIYQLIIDN